MDPFSYFSSLLSTNATEDLYIFLQTLPLQEVEYEPLLRTLLEMCMQYKSKEFGKIVLDYFSSKNVREDQFPLKTEIFGYASFSDELLQFISLFYPTISTIDHLVNLIDWKDDSGQIAVAEKVYQIYGGAESCQTISAYNLAQSKQNYNMMRYLQEKVEELGIEAPEPDWMLEGSGPSLESLSTVTQTVEDFELPPEEMAVDIIINTMGLMGIAIGPSNHPQAGGVVSIEELKNPNMDPVTRLRRTTQIKDLIRADYRKMSENQKRDAVLPYIQIEKMRALDQNVEYFRILGPVNPQVGRVYLDQNDPCYIYGGCRMFICNHYEQDEEVDILVDWFSGHCDYCLRTIKTRFRAIRFPLKLGGWVGCFCTVECLLGWGELEPKDDDLDRQMIANLETRLMEYGIYDRPEHRLLELREKKELPLIENPVVVVDLEEQSPEEELQKMLEEKMRLP